MVEIGTQILFTSSGTLWDTLQYFAKRKTLYGCEIKNFQSLLYWFSIHEIVPFWDLLGPYSPKYC